mgnify:CR=1 FL=1
MYAEITKKEALQKYLEGDNTIAVICQTKQGTKQLYTLQGLFSNAGFLIDQSEDDSKLDKSDVKDILDKYKIEQTTKNDYKVETEDEEESSEDQQAGESTSERKGKKITIDVGKLFALKRAGWSQKAIAEELGCSQGTVSRYARDKDLERRILDLGQS